MKNEKIKRTITGSAILLVTLPTVFLTGTPYLTVYMLAVGVIGIYELLKCVKLDKWYIIVPAELMTVVSHLICRLRLFGLKDISTEKLLFIYICEAAVFIFYLFSLSVFVPDKYNITENGFAGLMCIYIIAGTVSPVMLCEIANGYVAFPIIFISAWMTDVFAYFVGATFGKHKLCPTISPKKSIEGALGGVAGNIIGCCVYSVVIRHIITDTVVSYPKLIVTALVLSVVSQLGDLIMSLVKRRYGIKDFGKLLPGHGGILDRFDSVIPVSIFIFIIYTIAESARGLI